MVTKTKRVSVRLTEREHAAVAAWAEHWNSSMSTLFRTALLPEIPPKWWPPVEPPPGQLSLIEAEGVH